MSTVVSHPYQHLAKIIIPDAPSFLADWRSAVIPASIDQTTQCTTPARYPMPSPNAVTFRSVDGRLAVPRVERSKSLNSSLRKCARTEGEKKVVCFADSMGLDLCQVKPIFPYNTSDEDILCHTPPASSNSISSLAARKHAFCLLNEDNFRDSRPSPQPPPAPLPAAAFNCPRYLQLTGQNSPIWKDPSIVQKELLLKAKTKGVALKSSSVMGMTFCGVVAVKNISFEKKVSVRYTIDDWRSFVDSRCHYLNSLSQEGLDLFSFNIYLPPGMPVGGKCHFCLRYECDGRDFWDNNDGANYVLEVRSLGASFMPRQDYEQPIFY